MRLQRVRELPKLKDKAIELAVLKFIKDSRVSDVDLNGMYQQTLESIAQATVFSDSSGQQFWLCHDGSDVLAYALCHISKDIDNRLTYHISQAWITPQLRGKKIVKVWKDQLREEAKRLMCSHIMLPSSRNTKAYLRFLGGSFHVYATLIKEDI